MFINLRITMEMAVSYSSPVTVQKTGDTYPIAQTQVHKITEGRPVVRETTLAKFIESRVK